MSVHPLHEHDNRRVLRELAVDLIRASDLSTPLAAARLAEAEAELRTIRQQFVREQRGPSR